jgi:hypothetical protein
MGAICFSETLVLSRATLRRHNPENSILDNYIVAYIAKQTWNMINVDW